MNDHTIGQIASLLNEHGFRSGTGLPFTAKIVAHLCRDYQLTSRYDRLREAGKLTLAEIAEQLQVSTTTVKIWRRNGLLRGHPYNDKNECLFDPPDQAAPSKAKAESYPNDADSPRSYPIVRMRCNMQHSRSNWDSVVGAEPTSLPR